jgi:protein tyrosine phosphatase (PTP) superfamily phosphohydrolase (DUF442 family)
MRGAWLGLFAADLWATGILPSAEANGMPLSMPAREAMETVLALGHEPRFDLEALLEGLAELSHYNPDADFSSTHGTHGGLMRCLAVSLWFRSRQSWRLLEALDRCLDITDVPPRARVATLALCLWARELHRGSRTPAEAWQRYADPWSNTLLRGGYEQADVEGLLSADGTIPGPEADEAMKMVRSLRQCAEAESFEHCLDVIASSDGSSRPLIAAAGLIFGLARGDGAIPEASIQAALGIQGIDRTLTILLDKQRACRSLQQNPDVTSVNCPLTFSPIDCRQGRIVLTTAPGASMTMGYSDRGVVQINRDMATDIARIAAQGISHILTLLPADKLMDAGMTSLRMATEDAGLTWLHLPVTESDFPDKYFKQDLAELQPPLQKALDAGRSIAVHATDWHGRLELALPRILASLDPKLSTADIATRVEAAIALGSTDDISDDLS